MKFFKSLKQLKYAVIVCAVLSLAFLELIYHKYFGHPLQFVMLDLFIGTVLIIILAQVAFYFGEQLQNQLTREIEERKEVEEKLLLRSKALEAAANAIAITDENGRFIWINHAFSSLTGYSREELVDQSPSLIKSGVHDEAFYRQLWETIQAGHVWHGEIINKHRTGYLYTEEQIITPVFDEEGVITNYIAIKHDISKRKEAERKLQKYAERLRLIHAIDQAILKQQSPDEIAYVVLDYANKIIPYYRGSVVMIDGISLEGRVIAVLQDGKTAVPPGYTFPMSNDEIAKLEFPKSSPLVEILDLEAPQTKTGRSIQNEGIVSHIKISLIAQGKLVGFFNLGAQIKDAFTDEHIAIAEEIATSLAIALQQAKLYLRERQQREQAESLREIGEALNATLNFDEILNLLLGQVHKAIRYDSANMILIDGDVATIHNTKGYERYGKETAEKVSKLSFKISETPNLSWIMQNQEPLIIPDVHQYEGWRKDKGVTQTRSWVGVPIFVNGSILVLFALSKQQPNYYQESHVNILRAFASQVGLALENARLYEELRAYADELETRVSARTQALADANERLKELDRLKTKFISDVSHELRTPITNVTMYLDLMERGIEDKRDHYLTILKQETRRLSLLIEDIFDESQYTSHLKQADYMPVDMNEVIFHALKVYQMEAEQNGLNLTYDLDANLPVIWGEPLQLNQVMSNLLRNAINYTTEGKISVSTYQEQGFVTITVNDTGQGVSAEDLPHLFERFYRGGNVSQSTIPGTGLGLGVVREIIELHGGTVTAGNNQWGGASFKILLPVSRLVENRALLTDSYEPQNAHRKSLVQ